MRFRVNGGRPRGLALLDGLFRTGTPPSPVPDGRYRGSLVALDIAPALMPLVEFVAAKWMPWQGKTFDAEHAVGDNIFTCDSLTLAHLYWPRYHSYVDDGPRTFGLLLFAPPLTLDSWTRTVAFSKSITTSLRIRG